MLKKIRLKNGTAIIIASSLIAGCGAGGSSNSSSSATPTDPNPSTKVAPLDQAKALVSQIHDLVTEGKSLSDDWDKSTSEMPEVIHLKKQQMFFDSERSETVKNLSVATNLVACLIENQINSLAPTNTQYTSVAALGDCDDFTYGYNPITYQYLQTSSGKIKSPDLNMTYDAGLFTVSGSVAINGETVKVNQLKVLVPMGSIGTSFDAKLNAMDVSANELSLVATGTSNLTFSAKQSFDELVSSNSSSPDPKSMHLNLSSVQLVDAKATREAGVFDTFTGSLTVDAGMYNQPYLYTTTTTSESMLNNLQVNGKLTRTNSSDYAEIGLVFNIDKAGLDASGLPAQLSTDEPVVIPNGPTYTLSADKMSLSINNAGADVPSEIVWTLTDAVLNSSTGFYSCNDGNTSTAKLQCLTTTHSDGSKYSWRVCNSTKIGCPKYASIIEYLDRGVWWNPLNSLAFRTSINGSLETVSPSLTLSTAQVGTHSLPVVSAYGDNASNLNDWAVKTTVNATVKSQIAGVTRKFAVVLTHGSDLVNSIELSIVRQDKTLNAMVSGKASDTSAKIEVSNQDGAIMIINGSESSDWSDGTITVNGEKQATVKRTGNVYTVSFVDGTFRVI